MRMAPIGSYVIMLGPSLVDCSGRIRKCDLGGGVLLEARFQKPP